VGAYPDPAGDARGGRDQRPRAGLQGVSQRARAGLPDPASLGVEPDERVRHERVSGAKHGAGNPADERLRLDERVAGPVDQRAGTGRGAECGPAGPGDGRGLSRWHEHFQCLRPAGPLRPQGPAGKLELLGARLAGPFGLDRERERRDHDAGLVWLRGVDHDYERAEPDELFQLRFAEPPDGDHVCRRFGGDVRPGCAGAAHEYCG